jgi:hypothetical protein
MSASVASRPDSNDATSHGSEPASVGSTPVVVKMVQRGMTILVDSEAVRAREWAAKWDVCAEANDG